MIPSGKLSVKKIQNLLFMLWFGLLLNACAHNPPLIVHADYYGTMEQDAVSLEIARLESSLDNEQPEKYIRLATLYAHPANESPEYDRSLRMLGSYLSLEPDSLKKNEVLFMKNLLEEIVAARKRQAQLATESAVVKKRVAALEKKNASLAEENRALNDSIEKLKLLEIRLEEKRLDLK